jgi:hypothetical protein
MNYPLGNCFFEDFANEYAQMIQQIRLELPERRNRSYDSAAEPSKRVCAAAFCIMC